MKVILAFLLFAFISCDQYAVLVAGSNTYSNYRHQSDIFHHYHILVDRGVKPKTLLYLPMTILPTTKEILSLVKSSIIQMDQMSMLVLLLTTMEKT